MKRPSVHDIVFRHHFPNPKSNEAQNFYTHVQRNLVPEVRVEVQTFYGALDSLEAQYPGLDYSYGPHRKRLDRFPWHKKLFEVFNELQLTRDEILSICQWEGTKSAKDKYEAETGRVIKDTTMDGVAVCPQSEPNAVVHRIVAPEPQVMETASMLDTSRQGMTTNEVTDDEHDELDASVGAQLNDQLMSVEDGDSPNEGSPLEEWLKYMNDREVDRDSILQAIRAGQPLPTLRETSTSEAPVQMPGSDAINTQSHSRAFSSIYNAASTSTAQSYGMTAEEMRSTATGRVQG